MTTSPSAKTPAPNKDKENNVGEPTPFANMPSALKLGTPFFQGTRRRGGQQQGRDDGVGATNETPVHQSFGSLRKKSMQAPANFPDELPLQLFKERLSPRKLSARGEKACEQEQKQEQSSASINKEAIKSPNETTDDKKERQVRWMLPETTVKEPNEADSESSKPSGLQQQHEESIERDSSIVDHTKSFKVWENEHDLTPCKSCGGDKEDELVSPIACGRDEESQNETHSKSQGDDFSAMIDALTADFQQDIATQQLILENLSSGGKASEQDGTDSAVKPGSAPVKLMERELAKERKKREELSKQFSEERAQLLAQMEEVRSNAELSVRLAREEAKQRAEEALSVFTTKQVEIEGEKKNAITEAEKKAATLLQESKKREEELRQLVDKLRTEHSLAHEKAREEWKHEEEAALSIQKAAVTQSLQREIFEIETELLETLDELEVTKDTQTREKLEAQALISTLKRELEEEREKVQNATDGLQKEVEMFRVQLEMEWRNEKAQEEKKVNDEFSATISNLQDSLRQANESIETIQKERKHEVLQLENEVQRLKELLKTQEGQMAEQANTHKSLVGEYNRLKAMVQECLETISFIRGEEPKTLKNTEGIHQQLSELQEHLKQHGKNLMESRQQNVQPDKANVSRVIDFLHRINTNQDLGLFHAAENCLTPVAVKPCTVLKAELSSSEEMQNGSTISATKNSAFSAFESSNRSTSSRDNPNAIDISLVNKKSEGYRGSSVSSSVPVSEMSLMSETTENTNEEGRSEEKNISKLRQSRASLVAPHRSSHMKTPAAKSVRTLSARNSTTIVAERSVRTSSVKPKPTIPRVAALSQQSRTADSSGTGVKPRPHGPRETINKDAPTPKATAGLPKPSTSKLSSKPVSNLQAPTRRVATKTGLPPRRSSHIPQGKQAARGRPSMVAERNTPSIARTRELAASSNIPRTGQTLPTSISKGVKKPGSLCLRTPTTSSRTTKSKRTSRLENVKDSMKSKSFALLATPARNSDQEGTQQEPSSQQVRDKFSSLCNTWSTTKTPRSEGSPKEMPPSLKLDQRFDSSLSQKATLASTPSSQRRLSLQQRLRGSEVNFEGRSRQTPVSAHPFSIEFSSHDDDDDLLLSPVPQPSQQPKGADVKTVNSIISAQAIVRSFLARLAYKKLKSEQQRHIERIIVLQSVVRCKLAKAVLRRRLEKVIVIQSAIRCKLAQDALRRHKMQQRRLEKIIIIQSTIRCKLAKDALRRHKEQQRRLEKIIIIQSAIRCKLSMIVLRRHKEQQSRLEKVIVLQSAVRCQLAKSIFLERKRVIRASVKLQSSWRRFLGARKYSNTVVAAVRIQGFLRCARAVKVLQEQKQQKILRQNLLRSSAILLQTQWRRFADERQYKEIQTAATKIQAIVRCHLHASRYLATKKLLKSRNISAIKIQSRWRLHAKRSSFVRFTWSIREIQQAFRKKQGEKLLKQQRNFCATLIQKEWRKKRTLGEILKRDLAAKMIQRYFKYYAAQRCRERIRKACITIQSRHRGNSTRLQIKKRVGAVVLLQSTWRRKAASENYAKVLCGIIGCQRRSRIRLARKKTQAVRKAIECLQSIVRCRLQRRRFVALLEASVKVQTQWRRHFALQLWRLKVSQLVKLQSWTRGRAAVLARRSKLRGIVRIQKQWRMIMSTLGFKKMKHSATILQTLARCWLERRRNAVLIQRMYRGSLASRKWRQLKQAAMTLQIHWRRHRATKQINKQRGAIIAIQRWSRLVHARSSYRLKRAAAARIQNAYRATRCASKFSVICRGILTLQSIARSRQAVKQFERTLHSVILIQAHVRGSAFRRHFMAKKQAASTIQKKWRHSCTRTRSCVAIQAWTRKIQLMYRYHDQKKAAICLQKIWRGRVARRSLHTIQIEAIRLQSFLRSCIASKRFRVFRQKVVVVQSIVRRNAARQNFLSVQEERKIATLLNKRRQKRKAILFVQRWWRARMERRRLVAARTGITRLQSVIRSRLMSREFEQTKRSVVVLQTAIRKKIEQQHYVQLKRAALVAQAAWRRYASVSDYKKQMNALSALQRWSRMCIALVSYRCHQENATKIQAFWRSASSTKQYKAARSGVIKIQSLVRSKFASGCYQKTRISVILIQRILRQHYQKKLLLERILATTILQAAWRRKTRQTHFRRTMVCVVALQSLFRARLDMKRYNRVQKAIVDMQRFWRGNKERALCQSRVKAACIVQTVWRKRRMQNVYQNFRGTIVLLQSHYRRKTVQEIFCSKRMLVVSLQRASRGFLCRNQLARERQSAILIQSHYRATLVRESFRVKLQLHRRAVPTIQAGIRGFLARKSFRKKLEELRTLRKSKRQPLREAQTPAPLNKRLPLTCLRNETHGNIGGRQPLSSISKGQARIQRGDLSSVRKPLGDVSSIFSPPKTRGLKRNIAQQDQENVTNVAAEDSPCPKRRKSEVSKPAPVPYPRPDQMKVVELRQALQSLGVRPKDIRKVRKAQLITMLEQIQQGTGIETAVASLT